MTGPTRRELAAGVLLAVVLLVVGFVAYMWWDQEGSWNPRAANGYEITDDDGIDLVIWGGCDPDVRATVIEQSPQRVRVLLQTRGESEDDCARGGTVTLDDPLDNRPVFDAFTGDRLERLD